MPKDLRRNYSSRACTKLIQHLHWIFADGRR
jgi:hypothetical protein